MAPVIRRVMNEKHYMHWQEFITLSHAIDNKKRTAVVNADVQSSATRTCCFEWTNEAEMRRVHQTIHHRKASAASLAAALSDAIKYITFLSPLLSCHKMFSDKSFCHNIARVQCHTSKRCTGDHGGTFASSQKSSNLSQLVTDFTSSLSSTSSAESLILPQLKTCYSQ